MRVQGGSPGQSPAEKFWPFLCLKVTVFVCSAVGGNGSGGKPTVAATSAPRRYGTDGTVTYIPVDLPGRILTCTPYSKSLHSLF